MSVSQSQNRTSRRRLVAWLLPILACLALWAAMPQAGAQRSPIPPVRLYIFDCGHLKSGNPEPLVKQGITTTDMSVAAYLIVHPRGTLLWDSGVIPDDLIKPAGTTEARATVHTTLKGQLAEIGYKPSDITYLALSHNHYDHSANANDYAGSTWLVQKPERDFMFPDTPPANPPNGAARYSGLKYAKTILLDGDYDVFGDGSVVIIATPGHTPGHQSLFVKLAQAGPVVLSGDLYHYPSERTIKGFTPFGNLGNADKEAASKAKVESLLIEKGATLWIQHDILQYAGLKKSPAYYD
ncbi:MAG TPA: N-acyl homoserine lactonase family protein [Bryobacteraceae bacterium]|jgi:glyoxylase-like metal-dependent hydrolase (beta-lactamase superfamily II)|nr:N-acyl homoserine lactonase family protein [Bryobacteraceae bacterium]